MTPTTHYARSEDVNIAYQTLGHGPIDLVFVPGWVSNIDVFWELPVLARMFQRIASFSRLILFDKRGTGLSDRVSNMPSLEVRMDDVRAVMDAVGSSSASLFGYSEGGPMCALFAATYPERVQALIIGGGYARRTRAPDYPWGPTDEQIFAFSEELLHHWGGPIGMEQRWPSMADDEECRLWWARWLRASASPAAAAAVVRMTTEIDVRHVLPSIKAPTLLLHSKNDRVVELAASKYMAERIQGAKLVVLAGTDHAPWGQDCDAVLNEIEAFLTGGTHGTRDINRVLLTVMFTDIVDSTKVAATVGDKKWREILEKHHALVRRELQAHRGLEVDTAGDGFLATFDGPARAVRCACAIVQSLRSIGLEIRAGIHTGECESEDGKVFGIAVHAGARIASCAKPGQVLVSSTVKDLVAGAGLIFSDLGQRQLKGVPGRKHLFSADGQTET